MSQFRKDLEVLINQNSMENKSNTPDFILADYLEGCLDAFDKAVYRRSEWYKKEQNEITAKIATCNFSITPNVVGSRSTGLETDSSSTDT